MTGSSTVRSPWIKLLALFVAAGADLSAGWFSPADAHASTRTGGSDGISASCQSQRGTPYRYGGSSSSGFDCSGFTMWTFDGHGASLPHNSLISSGRRTGGIAGSGTAASWVGRPRLPQDDECPSRPRRDLHRTWQVHLVHIVRWRADPVIWDRYYWGPRWVGGTRQSLRERHNCDRTSAGERPSSFLTGSEGSARPRRATRSSCTGPTRRACCETGTRRSARRGPQRRTRSAPSRAVPRRDRRADARCRGPDAPFSCIS